MTDKLNQLTMDEYDYKKWALDQEVLLLQGKAGTDMDLQDQITDYKLEKLKVYETAQAEHLERLKQQELEAMETSFEEQHTVLDSLRSSWGLTWDEIRAGSVDVWKHVGQAAASISQTIGSTFTAIVTGSRSAVEAGRQLFQSILAQAINTLIQIGVQRLILSYIQKATLEKSTIATVAAMAAITAAATPAAIMTTIASFGEAPLIGAGAFTAAVGTMTGVAAASRGIGALLSSPVAAAHGGIFTEQTWGTWAEDGDEAIVPLSPRYRSDGQKIFEQIAPVFAGSQGSSGSQQKSVSIDGGAVDVGGIHFHGDMLIKSDTDARDLGRQIGYGIEDVIRGAS